MLREKLRCPEISAFIPTGIGIFGGFYSVPAKRLCSAIRFHQPYLDIQVFSSILYNDIRPCHPFCFAQLNNLASLIFFTLLVVLASSAMLSWEDAI